MVNNFATVHKNFETKIKEAECGKSTFGGWISNVDKEWLVEFLQEIQPKVIVEVGVFMGGTSNILLFLTGDSKYYAIDSWADGDHQAKPAFNSLKEGFQKTTEWAKDRITLIEGDSITVGKTWDKSIDLLYVDGNHDYSHAFSDISLFSQWVRPGGHILIDDYEMGPVIQATDELITTSELWKVLRRPDFTDKKNPAKLFAAQRV